MLRAGVRRLGELPDPARAVARWDRAAPLSAAEVERVLGWAGRRGLYHVAWRLVESVLADGGDRPGRITPTAAARAVQSMPDARGAAAMLLRLLDAQVQPAAAGVHRALQRCAAERPAASRLAARIVERAPQPPCAGMLGAALQACARARDGASAGRVLAAAPPPLLHEPATLREALLALAAAGDVAQADALWRRVPRASFGARERGALLSVAARAGDAAAARRWLADFGTAALEPAWLRWLLAALPADEGLELLERVPPAARDVFALEAATTAAARLGDVGRAEGFAADALRAAGAAPRLQRRARQAWAQAAMAAGAAGDFARARAAAEAPGELCDVTGNALVVAAVDCARTGELCALVDRVRAAGARVRPAAYAAAVAHAEAAEDWTAAHELLLRLRDDGVRPTRRLLETTAGRFFFSQPVVVYRGPVDVAGSGGGDFTPRKVVRRPRAGDAGDAVERELAKLSFS